jgi:hypothetical protein
VRTDDRKYPEIKLIITGQVERFANITPDRVTLSGPQGQELIGTVTILPIKERRFAITEAKATTGNSIRFTLEPMQENGQRGYRLTVFNTQQQKGRYFDTIVLKTDSTLSPELRVRVFGTIL